MFDTELRRSKDLIARILKEPHNAELRFQVGKSYEMIGRDGDALRWFESALHADARHIPTLQAMADFYEFKANQPGLARQYREVARQIQMTPKKKG